MNSYSGGGDITSLIADATAMHVTTQMRSRPNRDTLVRTPPRLLDDMDGRGWKIRGWVANG